jgi:Ni/Co efflux regulator RcnB
MHEVQPPRAAMMTLRRLLASVLALTMVATSVVPADAGKASKQDKIKAAQAGKAKAAARKQLTGRDHQGNHDSLTKPNKSGAKGDKHAKGIKQAGAAGTKKKK